MKEILKVSIGSRIIPGPWGGGNLFVKNLTQYLLTNGHEVIYDLTDPYIDLILLTDPRSRKESSSSFSHLEIIDYKKYINPRVRVVQRINECDERKGTNFINKFYLDASSCADHVVFVSSWLRNIYLDLGMEKSKTSVILAGANSKIFNPQNSKNWDGKEKIKLVTHHWSNHVNKGFPEYRLIDEMINTETWKNRLEFTYIGNMNNKYVFKNTKILEPLDGLSLASEIKNHHIYITASINEPSGNHHIEAAQCGLPILYKQSGGIPEYCEDFGVPFVNDLESKLNQIIENYSSLRDKMNSYSLNSEIMSHQFLNLFEKLTDETIKENKTKITFKGKYFILKYKILKILRENIYSNLKTKLSHYFKVIYKWIPNT